MGFLSSSSAAAAFLAGCMIIIGWMIAIHDDVMIKRSCGGCIYKFHKLNKGSDDYGKYLKLHKDAYPVTFAFAIICCVFWLITAAMAVIKPVLHLAIGVLNTIMFICVFVPVIERLRHNQQCYYYLTLGGTTATTFPELCIRGTDPNWAMKYMFSSYEMFWGSSMCCFLFAAYQIICATAMVYNERMGDTTGQKIQYEEPIKQDETKKPEPKLQEPEKPVETVQPEPKRQIEEIKKDEREQTPDNEPLKSFRNVPEPEPEPEPRREPEIRHEPEPLVSAKAASKVVRKGQVTPPKESPVPVAPNQDFSLTNI